MTSSNPRQRGVFGLMLAAVLFPATVSAQPPVVRPLEVYGTVGWGVVLRGESFREVSEVGGGARLFLTRRIAVQGDLLRSRLCRCEYPLLSGRQRDSLIGHVSFVGTWGSTTGIVRPYWLVGVSRSAAGSNPPYSLFDGGLGARIFVGDRYFLAPEYRARITIREDPLPGSRVSISAGIALGGK
jgi:hypothetical protein